MSSRDLMFTDGSSLALGTIYCIGKNYAAHAKEMGGEVPASPIIFLKPPAAYVQSGGVVRPPHFSTLVHHEVELVVVIGKDCADIDADEAHEYISGYAVGIDLTLRDIQNEAKRKGEPWTVSKAFRTSAPMSKVVPASAISSERPNFDLLLQVNGETKQQGNTARMERTVGELVAYISEVFTLRAGDVIFTGTPEGVAQVMSGDTLHAELKHADMKSPLTLDVTVE